MKKKATSCRLSFLCKNAFEIKQRGILRDMDLRAILFKCVQKPVKRRPNGANYTL